jgi:hypothetical protein
MSSCVQRGIREQGCKAQARRRSAALAATWTAPSAGLAIPERRAARAIGKYVKWAFVHPYNVLAMVTTLVLALISWSGGLLLVGVILELIFLCMVPVVGTFRRMVARSVETAERAAAQKAREEQIAQMGPVHRDELGRLEALIRRTRDNAQRKASAVGLIDDFLGLDRLTASYIRLAIAHKTSEECLSMTNRMALAETIRSLESAQTVLPERTRRLVQRRLSIAHQRAQCWDRTRDHVVAIAHQLATILELVHLMHDRSVTTLDSREVCDEVERFLTDLEDSEDVLIEVGALERSEPPSARGGEALRDERWRVLPITPVDAKGV